MVLVARDPERLSGTADEVRGFGAEASWRMCDLADGGEVKRLCAEPVIGAADILVTAAGINPRPHLDDLTPEEYERTLQVNLHAVFALGQAVGPRMAARRFGRILNVGSQQAWSAFGNSGAYGVSKAAVLGLTRSQAEAWSSRGVTANCLVPGFVLTPMTEVVTSPARADELARRTMIGRNGTVDDFAGLAVFLCSPSAGYVTGQSIAVDGGFSVH